MAKIADETITAYVDGVLPDDAAAAVEAAMATDPALAAKVVRERQLRRTRSKAPPPVAGAEIIRHDFRKPKAPPPPPKPTRPVGEPRKLPAWVAPVAALAIGLLAIQMFGMVKTRPFEAPATVGVQASGALAVGLDRKLSGEAGLVLIGATFLDAGGAICRSYRYDAAAGVACRRETGWMVRMTAPAPGDFPPAVNAAVADMMAGEPLNRVQEIARRDAGWR